MSELVIEDMINKIPVKIDMGNEILIFKFEDGSCYVFNHMQDCCETVQITDINGSLASLIGKPLLAAYSSSSIEEEGVEGIYIEWTFFHFRNVDESVTVKWEGESNGYYSVDVEHGLYEADDDSYLARQLIKESFS